MDGWWTLKNAAITGFYSGKNILRIALDLILDAIDAKKRGMKLPKRITEKDKKLMEDLDDRGMPRRDIAKIFEVTSTVVSYWLNDKYRARMKSRNKVRSNRLHKEKKSWRYKNPEKCKVYMREYMRKRYNEDEEFRNNIKRMNLKEQRELRRKRAKRREGL